MSSRTSSDQDLADKEHLLQHEESDNLPTERDIRHFSRTHSLRHVLPAATFGVLFLLFATNLTTFYVAQTRSSAKLQACTSRCGQSVAEPPKLWSRIRDLELKTKHVRFDSFLFDNGSPYRKRPSPEVDEAWDSLGADFRFVLIPEEEAEESDLSPKLIHFTGREDQANMRGYPANIEVFHQLHCLNLLRKATWYNYPHYRNLSVEEFADPDDDLAMHADHCIDNLRQRLMCTADVGLVPMHWVGDHGKYSPEFDRVHTCRDFDTLLGWARGKANRMGEDSPMVLPQPGDFRLDTFPGDTQHWKP